MTLIGNLYDEATILAVGHAFEQATEWHRRRPDMDRI
jgi:aspartyl-tRNA(Asn)/glutamyl-tRNA(Gln) amidotransferase subunit A